MSAAADGTGRAGGVPVRDARAGVPGRPADPATRAHRGDRARGLRQ